MLVPLIFAHPMIGWYLLMVGIIVGTTIYIARYVFGLLHCYCDWPNLEPMEWARNHPMIVIAAIALVAKIALFVGIIWIISSII